MFGSLGGSADALSSGDSACPERVSVCACRALCIGVWPGRVRPVLRDGALRVHASPCSPTWIYP